MTTRSALKKLLRRHGELAYIGIERTIPRKGEKPGYRVRVFVRNECGMVAEGVAPTLSAAIKKAL